MMLKQKSILATLATVLLVAQGWVAASALNFHWTNATKNVDGTTIPASGTGSIASTRIEYGTCNGDAFGNKVGEITVQGSATAGITPDLGPGTYCGRAYHKNTFGVESDPSVVAKITVDAPKPNPPTNFSQG